MIFFAIALSCCSGRASLEQGETSALEQKANTAGDELAIVTISQTVRATLHIRRRRERRTQVA